LPNPRNVIVFSSNFSTSKVSGLNITFAWLGRCRRLAKDFENLNRNSLAFLRLASIRLMLRKLCNPD
jgi:transposase